MFEHWGAIGYKQGCLVSDVMHVACSSGHVGGGGIATCSTYCRPLPMMPKFCAVATAMRPSSKGLNLTE